LGFMHRWLSNFFGVRETYRGTIRVGRGHFEFPPSVRNS